MNFVPENEMGVIVRFTQEIIAMPDISITSVKVKYPDAILLINGKKVRTEFEYLASNFISHHHDPRDCDLVICWIDDVSHKNKLPTWELSKNNWKTLDIVNVSSHQKEALYWECRARRSETRARGNDQCAVSQASGFDMIKPCILAELEELRPNMSQLANRLGVGRSTLYTHLKTLVEMGEVAKNGNGYEVLK